MQKTTLGADTQRVDGRDKVVGAAIYGNDRKLPRMAYAVPVVATIGKGRIVRIDTEVAARTPGVLLVLTHLDMDRLKPISFSFAGGQAIQGKGHDGDDRAEKGHIIPWHAQQITGQGH